MRGPLGPAGLEQNAESVRFTILLPDHSVKNLKRANLEKCAQDHSDIDPSKIKHTGE